MTVHVITATPASAYCTSGMHPWSSPTVPKPAAAPAGFPKHMRKPVANAVAQWNRDGSELRYTRTDFRDNWEFYPVRLSRSPKSDYFPGNAPGVAYPSSTNEDGQARGYYVWFNTNWTFSNKPMDIRNGKVDTQTIAVHEMGHVTGLAHPWPEHCPDGTVYSKAEQTSVMTTILTGYRRTLNNDDVAGVTSLY